MTNSHINKYAMYLVVIEVLDKFTALVETMPALVKLAALLKQIVTNIGKKSEEVGAGTSPKTEAKRKAESEMAASVVALVRRLHAYATEKNNVELMTQTDITESDVHDTRDAERGQFAASLVDMVEQHKAELTDYIVTDAQIASARQLIDEHDGTLGDRDSLKRGQTAGRDTVMSLFEQADTILEHQMDSLMLSFKKDNPEFYSAYESARVIKDIAAHRKPKNSGGTGGNTPVPSPDNKQ